MKVGKFIYFEFLIPVKDYVVTLKPKEILFDLILPIILSLLSYFIFISKIPLKDLVEFNGYVINALAILIGFSITCITILSTSGSDRINELKETKSDRRIGNKKIDLYQLIFITFSYSLIMEITTLIYNLLYYLIYSSKIIDNICSGLFFINCILLLHIVLLNFRNVTNFYMIYWSSKNNINNT